MDNKTSPPGSTPPLDPAELFSMLDRAQDTLYRLDTEGRVLWSNQAVETLLGYSPEELLGTPVLKLYADPADRERFLAELQASGGVIENYRVQLRRKDGSLVWVSTNAHYYYNRDGQIAGIEGVTRDFDALHLAEQALRESEQKFRTLAETSGGVVFVYRKTFLYANPGLEQLTGYSNEELLGMHIEDVVHPDHRELVRERAAARLRGEPVPTRYEIKLLTKTGESRWVDVAAGVIEYEAGPAGVATGFDITARKQMEIALRDGEEKYRQLVDLAQEGIWTIDENGVTSFVNPYMAELLGYQVEEMVGRHLFDFMDEQGRKICENNLQRRRNGVKEQHEFEFLHRQGRTVLAILHTAPITDEQGNYRGATASVIDITQRRRAEQALKETANNLRAIAENANDGILVNHNGRHVFVNRRMAQMLDYPLDDLVGTSIDELVHPDELKFVKQHHHDRLAGRSVPSQYETAMITRLKERLPVEVTAAVTVWEDQPADLMIVRDISSRKWAEQELMLRLEQQAAVAELGRRALATDDLNGLMQYVVETLTRVLRAEFAKVLELDQERRVFRLRAASGWKPDVVHSTEIAAFGDGQAAYTLATREPVIVEDLVRESRFQGPALLTDHGVKSGMSIVIPGPDGPYGVLGVHSRLRRSYTKDDINFLQAVTNIITVALERLRRDENLRQSEERFSKVFHANVANITISRLRDGVMLDANDTFLRSSGYSRDQVIGRSAVELKLWVRPEDRDRVLNTLQEHGSVQDIELPFRDRYGNIHYTLCSAELISLEGEPCLLFIGQDIGDRKRAEEALRASETKYRALVDHARDAIFIAQDNVIKFPNPKTIEMFGYTAEELLNIPFVNIIAPEFRDMVLDRHRRRLKGEQLPETYAFEIVTKTGERHWIEINAMVIPWEDRPATLNVVRDVTAHKQAEDALFQEKERAQVTLQSIGDGVITTDASGRIEYLNPVAVQLTGWPNDLARGMDLMQVFNIIDEGTRQSVENPVTESLRDWCRIATPGHTSLIRADGQEFAIEYSASPILDRGGEATGAVVVFRDVTEMRGLARQLSYQASHDALTSLINRREFENRLEYALESAKTERKQHALCYLDLDQFKVVNDTCGHVAGDELLRQLAARLQSKVRDVDTLARLGGDEFGVLLEGCPLHKARDISDQLRTLVKEFRFAWEDKTFEVGVSIGLVPIDRSTGTLSDVLSAADAACYVAKDLGRNRVHVYQPDDAELARRHGEMQWITRINDAIDTDRFELYCQIITPLSDRTPNGLRGEILLRMLDTDGQLVPPMAFIPAAERYNMMPALDRWVVTNLFKWLASGDGRRRDNIDCLAVNLSGQTLSDEGFLDFVVHLLDTSTVDASRLCFEITETAAIANATGAIRFIDQLKRRGCRFALDDFGSGLSSFAYLKNLKVDYLKIDGHFVRDIVDDPIDHAMVESINHIGHVMGLETIAEFVENERIFSALKALGVDYAQGFHVDSPQPLSRLLESPDKLEHSASAT